MSDMSINLDFESENFYTIEDVFNDINKSKQLYFNGDFKEAYPIIIKAAGTFDMFAQIGMTGPNINKAQYQAVYMLAGDICGELGKFDEALTFYKKHQFFNLQIKHDFIGNQSVTLFHFRGNHKSYTLHNLRNNEITVVNPRLQNDIVDSPIYPWLDSLCGHNAQHKKHLEAYKASFNYLRATSFCTDSEDCPAIENTLMWAHYANCHKGFCVQYELNEKDFSTNKTSLASLFRLMRIKYVDPKKFDEIINFTDPATKLSIRTGLATKSCDWAYENEVRMITYIPTDGNFIQVHLDTPNPIKAIYFGVMCPTQRRKAIMKIFENRPDVKFYQMNLNYSNIHRLTYSPI